MGRESKKIDIVVRTDTYCPAVSFVNTKEETANDTVGQEEPKVLAEAIKKTDCTGKRWGIKALWSRAKTSVVVAIAVLAITLIGLKLLGFRTFTVMSGSMEPEYPVGALIYVRPVNYESLKVGDVISYVANDEKTVVTHRIVDVEVDKDDSSVWRFRTKGDANTVADSKLVHYKNVLGTPIIIIPLIGYFVNSIQQPPGIYITLVVGTLLLAWTFLPETLEERRKTARKSIA